MIGLMDTDIVLKHVILDSEDQVQTTEVDLNGECIPLD